MFEKVKEIYEKIMKAIGFKIKIPQLDTLDYEKIIKLMKEKGTFDEFQNELNNFDEIEELMNNKTNLHGINHVVRVLFNSYAISALENLSDEDRKILVEAAKLHDIGRISDGEDREHGNQGAIKARTILENKGFNKENIDLICFIIKEHSLPKKENQEHVEELPQELRERYKRCLDLLKDADKLDRVRLGDLDPKRLSTNSAKRLIEVAKDVFQNNRHYYKKKMKVYPFDEEEAKRIYEEIKKEAPEIEIDFDEIKRNYSKYKSISEQGKIKWIKHKSKDIPLNDFIEILTTLSREDMKYIRNEFRVPRGLVCDAIYEMGIDKLMQLKADGKLENIMHINNYNSIWRKLTSKEEDTIMDLRKYDEARQVITKFYLYYRFIKNATPEELKLLQLNGEDKRAYNNSGGKDGNTGYKWKHDVIKCSGQYEMAAIQNMDAKVMLEIREKHNIPVNVMITGMIELDLFKSDLEIKYLEKILLNYYRFRLNVKVHKDWEQLKKLLLDLPDDLDDKYDEQIRECLIGRFKRFKLDTFEQVKNCERICSERILAEFETNDNVHELRKIILETRFKDLNAMKRDIYFYKKYMGEKATENEIFSLFETLLATQDKAQLLEAYNVIDSMNEEFCLDNLLGKIRKELSEISREDVVTKMSEMQDKIQTSQTQKIGGQEVIDLTGTDFNLLISVIGGSGSPYLVEYHNALVRKLYKYADSKILFSIMYAKFEIDVDRVSKKHINKRYKLDPLKNKQRCVSSIDENYLGHIRSSENEADGSIKQMSEKLILAYFPQRTQDISYMGNQDLMTSYDKERTDPSRRRIPHKDNMGGVCDLKLEDLNTITLGNDNEIVIDSYPGAVMCFDAVSSIAVKTAQRLNIPILYIDSKKQFEIMKTKLDERYSELQRKITSTPQITDETFLDAFNVFEGDIIHEAFRLAHGFSFLDDSEYPKEEIVAIMDKMKNLVTESLARCNDVQRETIQSIMSKEANIYNVRYGNYYKLIDFNGLNDLVKDKEEEETK